MSDLSLFRRNRIDHRVSAHSASYSKLGPRLFAMNGSKKKKIYAGFSRVEDTYQTYEGKSVNGSITRKYYYKNGQRCDVFGRTINDVGHTPVIGIEKHRPISYPLSNQFVDNKTHPKKNFYKTWGLDSGLLLDINKSKLKSLSASDVNMSSLNLLRNLEKKIEDSEGKSKNIHFKIFNPRNKQISRLIVNDDVLWYHMNYPIQVPDFSIPEVSYKSLNLRDNIIDKFMSTN